MTQELLTDEQIEILKTKYFEYPIEANKVLKASINTIEQLQKEKAGMLSLRIEQATALGKAQEMVASLYQAFSVLITRMGIYRVNDLNNPESYIFDGVDLKDSQATAKAFRQNLCDEIVGKIQAYSNLNLQNQENTAYAAASTIAFVRAIDIVKSILGDPEEPRPERFSNPPDLYGVIPLSNQCVDDWVAQKSTIDYSKRMTHENNPD